VGHTAGIAKRGRRVCNLVVRLAFLLLIAGIATSQTVPSRSVPIVFKSVSPDYTREAIEAKLQGAVVLTLVVETDGIPSEIGVVRGLGRGLDQKATECLQKWRFRPAARAGEPIRARATVEMHFRLPLE
jgi:TonB family protein